MVSLSNVVGFYLAFANVLGTTEPFHNGVDDPQ
jgi:hypothetical protein